MSRDIATQTYSEIEEQKTSIIEISSEVPIVCEDCKESLPAKFFHRYKNKKTESFLRMKRCNACRQKNPKCSKPKMKKEVKDESKL